MSSRRRKHDSDKKYMGRRANVAGRSDQTYNYSYHQKRAPSSIKRTRNETSSETMKTHNNRQRLKLTAAIVVVLCILLLELPATSNANVVIDSGPTDNASLPVASYTTAVEYILSHSILDHTKLILNSAALVAKLRQQFPEIRTATVSYSVFSWRPTVRLTFSEPVLILSSSHGAYLVGASGDTIAKVAGSTNLPVVKDESGVNPIPGQQILPSDNVSFISKLISQLSANGLKVSQLTLPQASAELDAYIAGQNYYVKFNLEGDPVDQAGTYLAAREYLAKNNITVNQYVDARLPGRIYYK